MRNGTLLLSAWVWAAFFGWLCDCPKNAALAYTTVPPPMGSFVITNCHDTNFLLRFGLYPPQNTGSKFGTNTFYSSRYLSTTYGSGYGYAAYLQSTFSPVQPVTKFTAYLMPADDILTNGWPTGSPVITNITTPVPWTVPNNDWYFYIYSNGWQFSGEMISQSGYEEINPYGGTWTLFPNLVAQSGGSLYPTSTKTNAVLFKQWWPQPNDAWSYSSHGQIFQPPPYPVTFTVGLGSNLDLSQSFHFLIIQQFTQGFYQFGFFYSTNTISTTNDYYAEPLDVVLQSADYCGSTLIFQNPPFANANTSFTNTDGE